MNFYTLLTERAVNHPHKTFIHIDDRRLTYGEFLDVVRAEAPRLNVDGDNCFISADSWIEQATQFFAAQSINRRPIILHQNTPSPPIQSTKSNVNDVFGVLSSGSSGAPKVLFRTFDSWAKFFPTQNQIFGVDEHSAVFIHGSLSFTGNLNVMLATMSVGATVVTSERLSPRTWLDLIDGCSTIYLVPTKLNLIASLDRSVASVATIFTGSQSITEKLRAELKRVFPNARLIVYYGASELNYITYKVIDDVIEPNNVGRAFEGVSIAIRDGLIYVDSEFHVSGLKTPATVGDSGHFNTAGELIYEGRSADFINKGGIKLSAAWVESVLTAIEGIDSAAVVKIDDARRGDDFVAFVVTSREENEVTKKIHRRLKPIERPAKIIYIDELPLNDRGKIDVHALRSKLL